MSSVVTRKLIQSRRRELRRRLNALPHVRRRRRRRLVRGAAVAAVVLVLLCLQCDCERGAASAPSEPRLVEVNKKKGPPSVPKRGAVRVELSAQRRPGYELVRQDPRKWVEAFRLQVAARSPRLAECFSGAERPGAIRWTASLNPQSGAVSDHVLEPVGPSPGLQEGQQRCLLAALSHPAYALGRVEKDPLLDRLSIVIEF